MIVFRADANPSIGLGHAMRCLSIADALSSVIVYPTIISGKKSIKFVLADNSISQLIEDRGYEPIVLNTSYDRMEEEIRAWEKLAPSIDADFIIVDSYFVTPAYLTWLKENIGTVAYIDDVLTFSYPADIVVNYNAYATASSYHELYRGSAVLPELILGPAYAPLRNMFRDIPRRELKDKVEDILLSTGGSDELHVAINFLRHVCEHSSSFTYHVLVGAMNTDKTLIYQLAEGNDCVVIHENVADMKSLISSVDIAVSAAGSTLYEICACGTPLITFSTADNQVPGAEAFEKLGLAVNVGDLRDPKSIIPGAVMSGTLDTTAIPRIVETVEKLAGDKKARFEMSRREQESVDARGAERLAEQLINIVQVNIRTV